MAFITSEQVKGFVIGAAKQAILSIIGTTYPDVDDSYKVTIMSSDKKMCTCLLQNEVQLNVASQWSSFIPGVETLKTGPVPVAAQYWGKGQTLQNCIMSRRMWVGTDPVSIRLELVFLADEDGKDVIEKVQLLQNLALPSQTPGGYLKAPGPDPFRTGGASRAGWSGSDVSVNVGSFLFFKSVVVQSVEVKYENRMSLANRKPTCAKVAIIFETYEVLTTDRLTSVYSGLGGKEDYTLFADEKNAINNLVTKMPNPFRMGQFFKGI